MGGFHHVEDQNDNYLAPAVDEIIEMNEEAKKVSFFTIRVLCIALLCESYRFEFKEGLGWK